MIKLSKKAYSLLGLACNAGKAVSGYTAVSKALDGSRVCMLLLAGNVSDNTVKQYSDKANSKSINLYIVDDEYLCSCVGHPERKVIAVLDDGFKNAILKEIHILNVGVNSSNE